MFIPLCSAEIQEISCAQATLSCATKHFIPDMLSIGRFETKMLTFLIKISSVPAMKRCDLGAKLLREVTNWRWERQNWDGNYSLSWQERETAHRQSIGRWAVAGNTRVDSGGDVVGARLFTGKSLVDHLFSLLNGHLHDVSDLLDDQVTGASHGLLLLWGEGLRFTELRHGLE